MYFFLEFFYNNKKEVNILTNINCLQNCIYQNDGKCTLEKISSLNLTPHNNCAYFSSDLKNHISYEKLYGISQEIVDKQ